MQRKPNRSQHRSNPKITFGLVLRQLREQAGDSQDAFAHRTGYHRNYVGQLERGEKSPSLTALFNLSKALGLRPSQMLERVEKRLGF
jgi:transcriptional regulator with XRE-family HTH domain